MPVVFAVVAVVVVAVADLAGHLVEDYADQVRPQPLQRAQHGRDRLAIGFAGPGHHDHAVRHGRHLQRLGEAQHGGRVQDHHVVGRGRFLEDLRQAPADQVGRAARAGSGRQDLELGQFLQLDHRVAPGRIGHQHAGQSHRPGNPQPFVDARPPQVGVDEQRSMPLPRVRHRQVRRDGGFPLARHRAGHQQRAQAAVEIRQQDRVPQRADRLVVAG